MLESAPGGDSADLPWRIHGCYGAVGNQGSIAVIEQFIRSMKTEC